MIRSLMRTIAASGLIYGSLRAAEEESVFRRYPLGAMDGDSALIVARSLVGDGATLTLDAQGAYLLAVATTGAHARLAPVFNAPAQRARNIRIEVEIRREGTGQSGEASLGVRGGLIGRPSGLDARVVLDPRLSAGSQQRSERVQQQLLVASGREAVLEVGEQVPYLEWLVDYGIQHRWLQADLRWTRVGSRLVVQPEVIGDGPDIRIRLTPELSGWENGRLQRIRFAAAATEVVVREGETVQIAGNTEHRAFYDRFLVGVTSGRSWEQLSIALTPSILNRNNLKGPPR